jgi:hypothetical protein
VNQSSYVVLMQLASDGSLEMLLPSEGRRDNFLRERQLYTFDCRAGKPGEEAGVWMIASRTPLVMGADIEGRAEASDILKRIVAGLPALPRQSWATSAWTWRVKPVAPPAVPPGPGEAEEEHRAPLE